MKWKLNYKFVDVRKDAENGIVSIADLIRKLIDLEEGSLVDCVYVQKVKSQNILYAQNILTVRIDT